MGVKGLMNYFQELFYLYNGHLSCPQKLVSCRSPIHSAVYDGA